MSGHCLYISTLTTSTHRSDYRYCYRILFCSLSSSNRSKLIFHSVSIVPSYTTHIFNELVLSINQRCHKCKYLLPTLRSLYLFRMGFLQSLGASYVPGMSRYHIELLLAAKRHRRLWKIELNQENISLKRFLTCKRPVAWPLRPKGTG